MKDFLVGSAVFLLCALVVAAIVVLAPLVF